MKLRSAAAGKKRLSRPKSPPKEVDNTEENKTKPKRKRQKLEKTETIELELVPAAPSTIDRKTTSFLEKMKEDSDIMSQLSEKSQDILMRRLSSIISPAEPEIPTDINLCQVCGMNDEIGITAVEANSPLLKLPVTIWEQIYSYLRNEDDIKSLRESYTRMEYIYQTFVSSPEDLSFITGTNSDAVKDQLWFLDSETSKNFAHLAKTWNDAWINSLAPNGVHCQPNGLSVKLYNYQLRALSWMLRIEQIVKNEQNFIFSSLMRVPGANIVYNTNATSYNNLEMFLEDSPALYEREEFQNSFTTQGGIFADEMGLGKTISMIALILSNPREQIDGKFTPVPNGIGKAASIKPPKFQSKATLVICPSHLVTQWAKEITSRTSLTVVTALTIVQHKKLTYSSLIDADVVIYAGKFLAQNPSYAKINRNSRASLKGKNPLVCDIGWHRIIVDEGHEVLPLWGLEIGNYKSNYRWYITGTPVPNGHDSLMTALKFLNCDISNNGQYSSFKSGIFLALQAVKRSLYWRNTKQSIGSQIDIPDMIETIELVQLSPIEQAHYDKLTFFGNNNPSYLEYEQRKFISDPTSTLKNEGRLLSDHGLALEEYQKISTHIKDTLKVLERVQARINENPNSSSIKYNYDDRLRYESILIDNICASAFFERVLRNGNADLCDNCEESSTCIKLPCGHYMCPPCKNKINIIIQGKQKHICPKCKTEIVGSDFSLPGDILDIPDPYEGIEVTEQFSKLRLQYGSKFARIAFYLSDVMEREENSKLIVFAKHENDLLYLKEMLEVTEPETFENKIVICKGNVHARNKQLERFTKTGKDAARIFLLSLKSSAAGTHLAVATHVLLLDPAGGTTGDARATDSQAIARAHRLGQDSTVIAVRFIVANTIDQKDYESVYGPLIVNKGFGPKSARK